MDSLLWIISVKLTLAAVLYCLEIWLLDPTCPISPSALFPMHFTLTTTSLTLTHPRSSPSRSSPPPFLSLTRENTLRNQNRDTRMWHFPVREGRGENLILARDMSGLPRSDVASLHRKRLKQWWMFCKIIRRTHRENQGYLSTMSSFRENFVCFIFYSAMLTHKTTKT